MTDQKDTVNPTILVVALVVLFLPALFIAGFKIRDAMRPTKSCNQICEEMDTEYVRCGDSCVCRPPSGRPVNIDSMIDNDNIVYNAVCEDDQ